MQNEKPTIGTLREFMEWVEQYQLGPRKCLFRGLPNHDHTIEASAWRRLKNKQDSNNVDKLLEINNGLIRDARSRGYHKKNGQELSDLEILAELQHFRVATFLIDFSYSAQVALWFACRQSFKDAPNSEKLSDGKVSVVFANPDRIQEVTIGLLKDDISVFFLRGADGRYPLYRWEPGELNSRIPPQHSVFLFSGDRTIKPDVECIIPAVNKRAIRASIENFSQTTETTLFPDKDGFIQQRTQDRPYVPRGYENYSEAGYQASQRGNYKDAISCFDEAISLNPTEASIFYARGEAKYSLGKTEESIPDFDEAIKLKDNDINYYKLRGYARLALDHLDDAKSDFERALNLAKQAEQVEGIRLIDSIRSKLHEIDLRSPQGNQWTTEWFKELVPEDIREHYDTQVGDEELYSLGAELQSLIQQENWGLECRFGRSYFVFCYRRRRVFGVNLFRNPRLAIWGTQADESKFSEFEPTYYPPHWQWVFPRGTTVEELRSIFESVYNDVQSEEQITLPDGWSKEQTSLF